MKLLYYSSEISAKQSAIQAVLSESGAEIELIPARKEADFFDFLPLANIAIIQADDFDRLLLQIISDAEKSQIHKKIAVLKEPEIFDVQTVSQILKQLYASDVKLRLPLKNGAVERRADEILYFEYAARVVYAKTEDNSIKTVLTLKELPALLAGCAFASPYVSFMVNLFHVEAIRGNEVVLKNGEKLPLSQKKAAAFRTVYKHYLSIMS